MNAALESDDRRPVIDLKFYPDVRAVIGPGLLKQVAQFLGSKLGPRCAIISDSNIASLFGEKVQRSLTAAGFEPILITIPPGEVSKTLEQVGATCDKMIAARLDRQSFVIGLGGGEIGDLPGFVAGFFHSGISW